MASVINASTNGLVTTGDNTGLLNIQVSGTNALTVAADKTVSFVGGGVTKNIQETATISATAATGTVNVDCLTSVVWYYTSNASANWTFNFRGNSGTTLDSVMSTGQSLTVAFLVQLGSTGYYATAITIDGVANTPVWQGGSAPSSGSSGVLDAYVYTIIKTSSATFKVLAQRISYS
jgi:hypothetical protein